MSCARGGGLRGERFLGGSRPMQGDVGVHGQKLMGGAVTTSLPLDGVFVHPRGLCESGEIGHGTRVWAFAHVLAGARIGRDCNICDGAFVENGASIGYRVTVKNHQVIGDHGSISTPGEGNAGGAAVPEVFQAIAEAKRARARVARVIDWRPQAHAYLGAFDDLSGRGLREDMPELLGDTVSGSGVDDRGQAFVDLTDVSEFERFILERSQP